MIALVCPATRHPLLAWLARGAFALGLIAFALWAQTLLIAVPAIIAALIAFGGCPMCWTFGLIERATGKVRKDAP